MKSSRFSMALALLVCVAMMATIVPMGASAALPSEQTFVTEGAEEATFSDWADNWERFDANTLDDYDTWCRTMHEVHGGTHAVYCAKNGYNSHYYTNGTQAEDVNITKSSDNTQQDHVLRYDTGMDAIMRQPLNSTARYYATVTINFWFWSDTGASDARQTDGTPVGYDFLNVIYYTGTTGNLVKHVAWTNTEAQASAKTWIQQSVVVPSNAVQVGFEFISGTQAPAGGDASSPAPFINMVDGGMREGVFLDDITIVGSDRLPAEDLATVAEPLNEYQNSLTFNVSWVDNDPQEAALKFIMLYYRVDGQGDWTKYETTLRPDGKFVASPIEFTAPREGTYEFFTRGIDTMSVIEPARNAADTSTTIDLSAPTSTIRLNGDGDGTNYKGTFSFSLSATDSVSNVDSIYYRLNGGNWTEYTAGVGIARNGTWTIDYYATDLAGNREATKSSTITLRDAAPGITIDPPVIASNGNVRLNFTISLNETTVTGLQYSLDDGDFVNMDISNRSVEFTGLSEGDHTLTIKATDSEGNVLMETTSFSTKSGGLGSILSDPLVLVGIVAVVLVGIAGAFYFVRRKK